MLIFTTANVFAGVDGIVVSNEFPSNKLMQENHVYKDSASFENTGVYEGTVYAIAEYADLQLNCRPGYYLPLESESCIKCPENSWCPGGEYTYSTDIPQGINACPSEHPFAPEGMWLASQCGRKLHIGDDVMYMHQMPANPTEHRFFTRVNDTVYSANTTPADIPMNNKTERKFKVMYDNNVYSVYDDSIETNEE